MIIRKEQMQAFAEAQKRRFVRRMMTHLRDRYGEPFADHDDEALEAFVRDGIDAANRYAVELEFDVRRFLECRAQHGEAFDRELAWARDILTRHDVDGTEKMDLLDAHDTFERGGAS